jgi:DDE superfamily endonuclease
VPDPQKGGIVFRRVQRKIISADPQRQAILSRLRAVYRHLPKNGALIFFDVKPVVIKAYGGYCWTRDKRLVLARKQKARGRFYLLLAYNVRSGKVHWAFMLGKSSRYVCQFMRQVRRRYPEAELWVALDQDCAHPCKSWETKGVFRQLKLHWISLPKASPDDNPVETIFSDIQQMVLDEQ